MVCSSRWLTFLAGNAVLLSSCFGHANQIDLDPISKTDAFFEKQVSVTSIQGITCYIDMGSLSSQLWGFMNWWPVVQLNMSMYDQYLNSLFSQLKTAGINQINLSFAQIAGIDALLNGGVGSSSDDVIGQMMVDFPGALEELIKQAYSFGINVDLAFGGENGTSMQICGQGETPEGQAQKLANFMKAFNISAVDFDLESTVFTNVNPPNIAQAFFQTLYQQITPLGKRTTLTIEGGIQDWPLNYLKELFYNSSGLFIFPQLFTDLNLMLYSATQYYLDANNPTWGIEQWLQLMGKKNVGMIHIGFEDAINYASPTASAGGTYILDTTNPGTAAAEIYTQLLQKLTHDGYPTGFAEPFFWPDGNLHAPGTWSRYETLNTNGNVSVNFATDMIKAFYTKLTSP